MTDLLPCPFCGQQMTLQGDYTHETAWNFYCHADIDESRCLLKDHRIDTQRDMRTPDYNQAIAWNTRSGGEPVAWRCRIGMQNLWGYGTEREIDWSIQQSGVKQFEKQALYAGPSYIQHIEDKP